MTETAELAARGYRLESFGNVLGRALTDEPGRVMPPGVEVYTRAVLVRGAGDE